MVIFKRAHRNSKDFLGKGSHGLHCQLSSNGLAVWVVGLLSNMPLFVGVQVWGLVASWAPCWLGNPPFSCAIWLKMKQAVTLGELSWWMQNFRNNFWADLLKHFSVFFVTVVFSASLGINFTAILHALHTLFNATYLQLFLSSTIHYLWYNLQMDLLYLLLSDMLEYAADKVNHMQVFDYLWTI